jgi:hypothetical protein
MLSELLPVSIMVVAAMLAFVLSVPFEKPQEQEEETR